MLDIVRDNWVLLLIGDYPHGPIGGVVGTLLLATISLLVALPCSVAMAVARSSHNRVVRGSVASIVWLMRGTPLLMVVFWANFLVPLLLGWPVGPFWVMFVALVVYESAYLSEVVRAGINALPRGQSEAARALGLPEITAMTTVILPQALYNSFPALLTQFVSIIKETSLGFVIGVHEFTYSASVINANLLVKPVEIFSILALTYFIICFSFASAARWLERRTRRNREISTP